jgi:RNA polymerase sigma-54 factor
VAALDLRSVIQEELQNNPTLEELPMEGMSLEKRRARLRRADANGDDAAASAEGTPDSAAEPKREEMDFSKEFEILGKIDEDWRDYMANAGRRPVLLGEDAERRQHFFDSLVSETSLQEHLMRQAELADLPRKRRWRPCSTSSAASTTAGSSPSRRPTSRSRAASRSRPCRRRSRRSRPSTPRHRRGEPGRVPARSSWIAKGRRRLARRPDGARPLRPPDPPPHPRARAQARGQADDVQAAIEEIGKLDPAPGRRFAEDSNRVVVPDVIVEKDGDEWKIHLNNDYIPRLRISSTYRDLIAKGTLSKARSATTCGAHALGQVPDRLDRAAPADDRAHHPRDPQGPGPSSSTASPSCSPLTMTQIADDRRRARDDGQPRHRQQVHQDAARRLRVQVFLHPRLPGTTAAPRSPTRA